MNLKALAQFFKDKPTVFAMLADVFTIAGVLWFAWNPFRIIGFYWLDTCIGILFFLLYFVRCRLIDSVYFFLMSLSFLSLLMLVYLLGILFFTNEIDSRAAPLDWHVLFEPYFDVSVFIIFSAFSHYHRYRKITSLDVKQGVPFNAMSTVAGMLLIPLILLLSVLMNLFIRNLNLSMILSLVALRNITEFWRFSTLRQISSRVHAIQPAS
jgi:hypothetical protein